MTTLRDLLRNTSENLNILREREAKHGTDAPLQLLNQIRDHEQAIDLLREALNTGLTEDRWLDLQDELRPLLLADNINQIDLDGVIAERPPQPFEPETILIPAGAFQMGDNTGQGYEIPEHSVELPAYRIGLYPVTNAQYAEFVKQTGVTVPPKAGWELARVGQQPPADKLNHPMVGISWDEAVAYCVWLTEQTNRQYRLPSEAEWEKAARGSDDTRRYPWGDDWDESRCNHNGEDTTAVDHFPAQSPYGVFDLSGNVAEWTRSIWGLERPTPDYVYPYAFDERESLDPSTTRYREFRVLRGGSYRDKPDRFRCSAKNRAAADNQNARRGFRVVIEL